MSKVLLQPLTSWVMVCAASCMLCMAPLASATVPCKSGQKAVQKGSARCVPAAAGKAKGKPKVKAKIKAKTQTMGAVSAAALAPGPLVPLAPLPSPAPADCASVQTLLVGAFTQCPGLAATAGLAWPVPMPANTGAACFDALAASGAATRLAAKVPFLSNSLTTAKVLVHRGVPNKIEKQALVSLVAGYDTCLDMAASWRQAVYTPVQRGALEDYWRNAKATLNALAAGKKNFGDAAGALAESDQAYRRRLGTPD